MSAIRDQASFVRVRLVSRVKRWTLLVHLSLGTTLCVLFVAWFVSGIVMMYQSYPALTLAEKVAAMPPLDCTRCVVPPAAALDAAGTRTPIGPLRLGMLGERPVWRTIDTSGRWIAVFADDGRAVGPLAPEHTARLARAQAPTATRATLAGVLSDADQWTLTRSVRSQMPLHRFDLDDPAGTRVYVAPWSGEAFSASTRRERALSWIGAIPHWIYPTMLRRHAEAWSWTVIVLSGLGTVMSLAGLAIGVWQWRWRLRTTSRLTRRTPYRDVMMRWHHLLGLGFGLVTTTWVFSGLMSMNPGGWSPGSSPTRPQALAVAGGPVTVDAVTRSAADAWRTLRSEGAPIKELHLTRVDGEHRWVAFRTATEAQAVSAERSGGTLPPLDSARLLALARRAMPEVPIVDAEMRTDYDAYYRDVDRQLPLPVLRVRFGDPDRTWMCLDPVSGTIRQVRDWRSRLERWLFDALHDWDYAWLISRRPWWDIVLITLSLGGAALSLTGVTLSWRYLRFLASGDRRARRR